MSTCTDAANEAGRFSFAFVSGSAMDPPDPTSFSLSSETGPMTPSPMSVVVSSSVSGSANQSKSRQTRIVTPPTPTSIGGYDDEFPLGYVTPQKKICSPDEACSILSSTPPVVGRRSSKNLGNKDNIESQRTDGGIFNSQNSTVGYKASAGTEPEQYIDYTNDMFRNLLQSEVSTHPRPYLRRPLDNFSFLLCSRRSEQRINADMRAILVDWLVDVHSRFRLAPETLYLSVNIVDRYCSKAHVTRSTFQLVGVTALFLACKYEEIHSPTARDCVYITDGACGCQEVLDMEQAIMKMLDWKISVPTSYHFLDRFLSLAEALPLARRVASYYLERILLDHDLLEYRPSLLCASAVTLAINIPRLCANGPTCCHRPKGVPKELFEYIGLDKDELITCMTKVAAKICEPVMNDTAELTAIIQKYDDISTVDEFCNVQLIVKILKEI
mmetsp:Transcript_20675/g.43497  ORF Transcript_20675/g.43497 Transcript_20675/m.43497 type:complete len:442 (+) Transcript_20675:81-1406(+)